MIDHLGSRSGVYSGSSFSSSGNSSVTRETISGAGSYKEMVIKPVFKHDSTLQSTPPTPKKNIRLPGSGMGKLFVTKVSESYQSKNYELKPSLFYLDGSKIWNLWILRSTELKYAKILQIMK